MTERIVPKRLLNVVLMFVLTIVFTFVVCWLKGFLIDQMGCILFLNLAFFMLFYFSLENSRMHGLIGENPATSYRNLTISYGISCVFALLCMFFPAFAKPVLLVTLLMSMFGTQALALTVGIYFSCILSLVANASIHELICECLLCMCGCLLSSVVKRKVYRIWVSVIAACISIVIPCVIFYLYNMELTRSILIGALISALLSIGFVQLLYRIPAIHDGSDVPRLLEEMIQDDYPMVQEIKQFSLAEYNHAIRVSNVSYRCALMIGADEKLAAAAGFYYRLGKLEGEPFVENGVKLARNHFFPESVVKILSEYGGEAALPSTVESAIVHMVDALVKKLEVMDKQTMQSEWNQDMLVYQTLNELSSKGIYDKSGMSMNLFLKIREHLVKEEGLL